MIQMTDAILHRAHVIKLFYPNKSFGLLENAGRATLTPFTEQVNWSEHYILGGLHQYLENYQIKKVRPSQCEDTNLTCIGQNKLTCSSTNRYFRKPWNTQQHVNITMVITLKVISSTLTMRA